MGISQQLSAKGTVKKITSNDLPFSPSQPVINSYYATSTTGQTIINLGFSILTTGTFANTDSFWLFVDGKKLDLGSSNDYTFTSVASDGTSSQVTLTQSLVAGLNIQGFKLGYKPEVQFTMDNRFTQLYANQAAGFQGFVSQTDNLMTATSSSGTPAAGQFYSSIVGRASMPDLSQDLKPRMGIERIMTQQIQQIQNEFGPNGEAVWSTPNDQLGQIRFVGPWANGSIQNSYGEYIQTGASDTTSYVEVTFYGTGLNLLSIPNNTGSSVTVSVDGGSTSSITTPFGGSALIGSRFYGENCPINIFNGLSLGIHTVKILSTNQFLVYGFEIINQNATATNISVNPGIVYNQGQKISTTSQQLLAYNAPVVGTTGGRVVVYQTSSGSIGQAFTQNATSPSYYTGSVSHANEEVVRTYYPKEFGCGSSTDFSVLNGTTGVSQVAFTLDDGTTSLSANGNSNIFCGPAGSLFFSGNSSTSHFIAFTFIGTGLDVQMSTTSSNTTQSFSAVAIDGTIYATTIGTSGQNVSLQTVKVCSGLPYGTHTVVFYNTTATTNTPAIQKFITYQPKTPSIPSGAVQIGSYNVMATYASGGVIAGFNTINTGLLRKQAVRELVYTGTWTGPTIGPATWSGGFYLTDSAASGNAAQYTFYGTAFECRIDAPTGTNLTFTIDGSNLLSVSNSSPVGGIGWTGSLAMGGYGGSATTTLSSGNITYSSGSTSAGVWVTGLPLGLHTVKVSSNNTTPFDVLAFDIATPIHSVKSNLYADLQNTLPVGSNAISDDRQIQPVKSALPATKAWAQALGVVNGPTVTTSATVPVPDLSCTIKTSGGPLKISYNIVYFPAASVNAYATSYIYVDGVVYGSGKLQQASTTSQQDLLLTDSLIVPVAAGVHRVEILWLATGGNATASGTARNLTVEEK